MNRRVFALFAVLLFLGAPGVVRAESRAFEFSSRRSSMRLLGAQPLARKEWTTADRIRAFDAMRHATVTSTSTDPEIHTDEWLVPLILTGLGLIGGVSLCAVINGNESECGTMVLAGIGAGLVLSLGYLYVAHCVRTSGCDTGDEVDEDSDAGARQARAKRSRAISAQRFPRGPRLPLGLAPSMSIVNDQAVFGLGRRF
ncbi:hypothetical protein LY474_22910 [Myxococcus stipitatus]|uniref:hypothetical protein n=1 Tax=Myxococcus stipitatus TaxID=83455 RepID=UPI001F2B72A9|nr:hypothetical protein [Myxococcus stipitatus]MCE9670662.1 hypothetical protein [Myxococcus stipitatus]